MLSFCPLIGWLVHCSNVLLIASELNIKHILYVRSYMIDGQFVVVLPLPLSLHHPFSYYKNILNRIYTAHNTHTHTGIESIHRMISDQMKPWSHSFITIFWLDIVHLGVYVCVCVSGTCMSTIFLYLCVRVCTFMFIVPQFSNICLEF